MQAVIARLKALEARREQERREERERKRRRRHESRLAAENSHLPTPRPLEQRSVNLSQDATATAAQRSDSNNKQRRKCEPVNQTENGSSTTASSSVSLTAASATASSNSIASIPSSPATTTTTTADIPRDRLPFGYFHGRTIFRNSIHPSELAAEGFVTLAELVPPNCQRILATTFCAPSAYEWLDQTVMGGPYGKYTRPSHLLLVHHGPFPIGEPELEPIIVRRKKQENWYKLACQPHTGGCMHPKVLLFRTDQGLRVVVSGNNFYQYQWENDRDCLWAQDFPISGQGATKEEYHAMPLKSFLTDLCQGSSNDLFIKSHLEAIFANIDLSQSKASMVYSFPRKMSNGDKGGWKQLTQVVQDHLLDGYDTENDYNSPNTPEFGEKPRYVLYAMSGSIGNVDPTLLRSIQNAMSGQDTYYQDFPAIGDQRGMAKEWKNMGNIQCLLPSLETASKMDPTWNGRLMSKSHWNSIPKAARQKLFADAVANPYFEQTQQRPKHPFAHAKVLYCKYCSFGPSSSSFRQNTTTSSKPSILYVGSHNLSKAAWGLADKMPGNVEVGVILSTSDPNLQQEWESRLPYLLPDGNTTTPSTNYRPFLEGDWKDLPKPNQMATEDGDSESAEEWFTQEPTPPKLQF